MDITALNSRVPGHESQITATDSLESLREQGAARMRIFRYLLSCVARAGDRVVDLGAGHCAFSVAARDMGCTVTAVDARTERKPDDADMHSIKFMESDVRAFDLAGYDVIVFLGPALSPRTAGAARYPATLRGDEGASHSGNPGSRRGDGARERNPPLGANLVRRGDYEGVVFPESDNPMASVGNPDCFRRPSLRCSRCSTIPALRAPQSWIPCSSQNTARGGFCC